MCLVFFTQVITLLAEEEENYPNATISGRKICTGEGEGEVI